MLLLCWYDANPLVQAASCIYWVFYIFHTSTEVADDLERPPQNFIWVSRALSIHLVECAVSGAVWRGKDHIKISWGECALVIPHQDIFGDVNACTLTSISGTKFVCLMCTLTIVSSGGTPTPDI